MKETGFIKHNIKKWTSYEGELKKKKKDPDQISKLFIQITDDLSYAQTFYRNRSVRVYLNGIAQLLFNDINKSERFKFKTFVDFWKIELPVIMYKARFELLFSLLIFGTFIGIGIISSIYQPEFARTILGDNYVDMTMANIEKNDPMAVYKKANELDMFLAITLNNIRVAFITFVFGVFFGIGTLFSLLRNGIMVGTFQYFFIERDLFKESFLTIWQHGSLEISAIVIAGAAGFTIGRGLIIPGSYTRFQSLRITAKRGLKIMLGLIPVFIMAGFIEGYFTRHTEAPDFVRITTIVLSFSFVLFYFVFYPRTVANKHPEQLDIDEKISASADEMPNLKKILSSELLFGGTLKIFKEMMPKRLFLILLIALIGGLVFSLGYNFFLPDFIGNILDNGSLIDIFNYKNNKYMFGLNTLVLTVVFFTGFMQFQVLAEKRMDEKTIRTGKIKHLINSLFMSMAINVPFFMALGWGIFFFIVSLPILIIILKTSHKQNLFFIQGIGPGFKLINKNFGDFLLLNLEFMFLGALLMTIISPLTLRGLFEFVQWNLWLEDMFANMIINFLLVFVFFTVSLIAINFIIVANSLIYYSMKEKSTDYYLRQRIKNIGIKNTIRGYEIED